MKDMLHYFAYGSNLHPLRLHQRVRSSEVIDVVELTGYSLEFHKRGQDGSAKCNAFRTDDPNDTIIGVIYEMDHSGKTLLDRIEGVGNGYYISKLEIDLDDEPIEAFAYLAEPGYIDDRLAPFDWYRELVFQGANYHQLPQVYIQQIESVPVIYDTDSERRAPNDAMIEQIRRGTAPESRGT